MTCLIIEDNPQVQELLTGLISDKYPETKFMKPCASVQDAIKTLQGSALPQLLLLDIELKDGSVFEIFEQIDSQKLANSSLIFITAYDSFDHLHKALKLAAIDFLVKPVDPDQLYLAIEKAIDQVNAQQTNNKINHLLNILEGPDKLGQTERVPFFLPKGVIRYEEKHSILYIEGEENICHVRLGSGEQFTSTRHLGFYKNYLLQSEPFFQTSKQHIVNLEHVTKFNPREHCLYLEDGTHLYVSRRKSKELSDFFKSYFG